MYGCFGLTYIENIEEWMIWEVWLNESKFCFGFILVYGINFSGRHLDI